MKLKKSVQVVLGIILGLVIIGIIHATGEGKVSPNQTTAYKSTADISDKEIAEAIPDYDEAPKAQEVKTISLFNSPEDFKTAFNKISNTVGFGREIDELKITGGKVQNSFQYMFSETVGIVGSVDKTDGVVKEVTMLGRGDGTAGTGQQILACMVAIISVADPSLEPKERGDILKKLKIMGDNAADLTDLSANTDYHGIHYYISSGEAMGIMFGVTKK